MYILKYIRRGIISVVILSLLAVSLVSCKEKENIPAVDRSKYSKSTLGMSCAETGMFLFEDGLIYFMPAESGEKTVFCFDPVCAHEPASYLKPDPECMAAGYYNRTNIAYHDGYIYLFVKDVFEHEVYRMDISAGTRELVAEIPVSTTLTNVVFDGDYAYYVASIGTQREDNPSQIDRYYELMELNLTDGSYRILTSTGKEKGYFFSEFDVCDGIMIYCGTESGIDTYSLNLDTLESELIVPAEENSRNEYCGMHDRENFYYADNETGNIGLYNINTESKQVLVEIENNEENSLGRITAGNGKIFYSVLIGNSDTETEEYFLYDIAEDNNHDITEKSIELGVYNYDPYKSMFLRYKLGEDGREILGFMVASEASVLGE